MGKKERERERERGGVKERSEIKMHTFDFKSYFGPHFTAALIDY